MSAAGERHLARVHACPCVIHIKCYGVKVNAAVAHHLEHVRGDHSAFATVPVCEDCHLELHERRRRPFYLAHKLTDVKLLAWTNELLDKVPLR